MPGAWEIEKQRRERVLLSVISPPELKYSEAWVTMWAQLQTPPGSERHAVKGLPYHAARNHALKFCLDKGAGYLFFLDSDVLIPGDGLMTLINTGLDFVGGYYRKRYPPFPDAACMLVRNQEGKIVPGPLPPHKPGEIIAVDCLPTGCTLMSRRCLETVIAKYPRPYDLGADIAPVPDGQGGMIPPFSEDYLFSIRAKELGFQPWLATGVSCAHEFSAKITAQGVEAL